MSDEPKKRSRAWMIWAFVILVAYPLLAGPSAWIVDHTDGTGLLNLHCLIFAPLDFLRHQSDAVNNVCRRYVHLWVRYEPGVLDGPKDPASVPSAPR